MPTDTNRHDLIDTPLQVLMVIESSNYFNRVDSLQFDLFYQRLQNSIHKTISKHRGKEKHLKTNIYLVTFNSVDDAISCALKIKHNAKYVTPSFDSSYKILNIGINSSKAKLVDEAIRMATYYCEVVSGDIVISSEVNSIYQDVHHNPKLNKDKIRSLKPREEDFLKRLMSFVEEHWNDSQFSVTDFSQKMGFSNSQLNRNIKSLTGLPPNSFIKKLRLQRALKLLYNRKGTIANVAFETGFNSPTYFSKCFSKQFGILPSTFLKQNT
ncbi:helix-turn-helix domain-containing protein [Winogradskyella sp. 3972H.M.0a.05]|uniref:helix-turn-helix domain-containing protein n=1 Tax=Winogradskyella sp. 3972H.M.0a.05 TaxID=2950277 RepID=UPI003392EA2F